MGRKPKNKRSASEAFDGIVPVPNLVQPVQLQTRFNSNGLHPVSSASGYSSMNAPSQKASALNHDYNSLYVTAPYTSPPPKWTLDFQSPAGSEFQTVRPAVPPVPEKVTPHTAPQVQPELFINHLTATTHSQHTPFTLPHPTPTAFPYASSRRDGLPSHQPAPAIQPLPRYEGDDPVTVSKLYVLSIVSGCTAICSGCN
jgi:hypothetical protein